MNISLKNLFNAESENCEFCCFSANITTTSSKLEFVVWLFDKQIDYVEDYHISAYLHLFSFVDSLPMNEKDKVDVLKYFNSFKEEWEATEEGWITDEELIERWNDGEEEL